MVVVGTSVLNKIGWRFLLFIIEVYLDFFYGYFIVSVVVVFPPGTCTVTVLI